MKNFYSGISSGFLCSASILVSFFVTGQLYASGCETVDKYHIANGLSVDKKLLSQVSVEIASCDNVSVHDGYVGFILNEKKDVIHSGIRSEVSIDFPFSEGETVEYRWSIMLPKNDFAGAKINRGEWWIIGQWHDQPDPYLGETWSTYKASPPPVAVYIETRNGVLGIGLQTMRNKVFKKHNWVPIPLDVWINLDVTIHWSQAELGFVSLRIDKEAQHDVISLGSNMLNNYQHYLKLGQYRSPRFEKKSVIYIKDVQINQR